MIVLYWKQVFLFLASGCKTCISYYFISPMYYITAMERRTLYKWNWTIAIKTRICSYADEVIHDGTSMFSTQIPHLQISVADSAASSTASLHSRSHHQFKFNPPMWYLWMHRWLLVPVSTYCGSILFYVDKANTF